MAETIADRATVDRLKEAILSMIQTRGGGVSFIELQRIDGFSGEKTAWWPGDLNIVLWVNLSLEANIALQELLEADIIVGNTTTILTYLIDGIFLNFPIAKQRKKPYKEVHWQPVVFSLIKAKGKPHAAA